MPQICFYKKIVHLPVPLMRQSQPSVYLLSSLTQLKTNQSICLLLCVPQGEQFERIVFMRVLKVNG